MKRVLRWTLQGGAARRCLGWALAWTTFICVGVVLGLGLLMTAGAAAQMFPFPGPGAPTAAAPPAGCTSGSCSDSFTGAAGTLLATHDSNWVSMDATNVVSNLKLDGSGAVTTSTGWLQAGAIYSTSTSDTAQIVMKGETAGTNNNAKSLCVRATANTTKGYCAHFNAPSSGNWTQIGVYKGASNVGTAFVISKAIASDHTVRVVASGTTTVTITVYLDGTSLGSVTDSTSTISSGHPGFFVTGNGQNADNAFGAFQDF